MFEFLVLPNTESPPNPLLLNHYTCPIYLRIADSLEPGVSILSSLCPDTQCQHCCTPTYAVLSAQACELAEGRVGRIRVASTQEIIGSHLRPLLPITEQLLYTHVWQASGQAHNSYIGLQVVEAIQAIFSLYCDRLLDTQEVKSELWIHD